MKKEATIKALEQQVELIWGEKRSIRVPLTSVYKMNNPASRGYIFAKT